MTLRFYCRSYGADVSWNFNNKSLPSNTHTSFTSVGDMFHHKLIIFNVSSGNDGIYTCHRYGFGFLQVKGVYIYIYIYIYNIYIINV